MYPRIGHYLMDAWKRARRSRNWPYLALLVLVILPLLWIAYSLAIRAGMFGFSNGPSSNAPSPEQVKLFLTFIGGGLATAATLFAALFTREHNMRERRRLRLETVLKSMDSLPEGSAPRVAGALSTMVLLGQQRIAIRVLEPAWERNIVDYGTATWLIGQVLTGDSAYADQIDGDRTDEAAIEEAAVLLANHADQLTDERMYYFPGHFLKRWSTEKELPYSAKNNLLLAMGRMLVSRDKAWWSPSGGPPRWPTTILVQCAEKERDPKIKSSAAVLVSALHDCFPKQLEDSLPPDRLDLIIKRAAEALATQSVQNDYIVLANRLKSEWGTP